MTESSPAGRKYDASGVRGQGEALSAVQRHLGPTFGFLEGAEVMTRFGHYASVLKLSEDLALAITTDGVGSKTLIASTLDRYDTIAFDCVAMNVNDLICVGARPLAMVDYLAVNTLDERRTDEILKGLGAAAKEAGIAIPGGELAQLPEIVGSDGRSAGDERAFDLAGAAVGTLRPEDLILGRDVKPGDALIGIASSGIHSNGLTLARKVLLGSGRFELDQEVAELGCTLGEELLRPTEIYVRAILDLWAAGIATAGLIHVTGDGFANLARLEARVGFRIEDLPERPPIFDLIQRAGDVSDAEMFRVFNMGVGFVVVVAEDASGPAIERITASGHTASRIGSVTDEEGVVAIEPAGLVGRLADGESEFTRA